MIDFFKDNQWLFWIITSVGTIISSVILLNNWIGKRYETNRAIYKGTLRSKYSQLFDFNRSDVFSPHEGIDNYNPAEISGICSRVVDFKEKGNKFKGVLVRQKFNRLIKSAKKIDEYTDRPTFPIGVFAQRKETYQDMYNENKSEFLKLKNRFKRFYLSIFDHL